MADFEAGDQSTATINGTELPTTGWSTESGAEIVRFRNSKTGGFTKKRATYRDCPFSIDIDWDFDSNPFTGPPTIKEGDLLTEVKLYLRGTSGQFWHFPSAIVVGRPQSVDIEGKIVTRVNCENDGTYSAPGE